LGDISSLSLWWSSFLPSGVRRSRLPETVADQDALNVGVAVLDKPVSMATYGALPEAGLVDTLEEDQRLTTLGYGANGFDIVSKPPLQPQLVYPDDRYSAAVRLLNTRDPALGKMFVKTTGRSLVKGKGEASCFGDSGGPLFVGDQQTKVGVTSFGLAPL
jgi:hypothetical protein